MDINSLPTEIRDLALIRRDEHSTPSSTPVLARAFIFRETPEGHDFWWQINLGNYAPYYARYPAT